MKPMLAFKYKEKKAIYPCYAQPKLDGVRGLWIRDVMQSRGLPKVEGKFWHEGIVCHINNEIRTLQESLGVNMILDGEMYRHGMSLQQINSRIAVNRTSSHEEGHTIKYAIFDVVDPSPFELRKQYLAAISKRVRKLKLTNIFVVETMPIIDHDEFELYHKLNRNRGFEGTMYREATASYGRLEECGNQENRWYRLMKRKERIDLDCVIIGVNEGRAGKTGMMLGKAGSLQLMTPEGVEFTCSSGALVIGYRKLLWDMRDEIKGTKCRISFPLYSDAKLPLQATIDLIDDTRFT
tara:strand:+ start:13735 stop:14616 length:882 start_codon:yes stop_codon:yes gene_type:complete